VLSFCIADVFVIFTVLVKGFLLPSSFPSLLRQRFSEGMHPKEFSYPNSKET